MAKSTGLTIRELRERHKRAVQRARNGVVTRVLEIINDETAMAGEKPRMITSFNDASVIKNIKKRVSTLKK